jgi:hypothetical protein
MSTFIEIGIYGGAAPFAVALALVFLARGILPALVSERIALAVAFAVAFFAGWVLLPDAWTPLMPARPWHWLPYLGLLAAALCGAASQTTPFLASGLANQRSLSYGWRLAIHLVTAVAAAWLLAPNWPDLDPPRYVHILLLAGYVFALMTLLDALPDRVLGRLFPFVLFAAASAPAIVIAVPRVLTMGQMTGLAAASLLGCGAAGIFALRDAVTRELVSVYSVLISGIAFWGSIDPEPPAYSILLAPLTPLMLWLCAYGPLARLSGWKAAAVQIGVVLVPLAILVAWTLLGGEPEYGEYEFPEWDY